MFILAGIDEAGLGPTLGPLATAAAALAVPDGWNPDSPWKRLSGAVADHWEKGDRRPAVADSKIIYRSGGLGALALALGAFSLLVNERPDYPVRMAAEQALHPCYRAFPGDSPLRNDEHGSARAAAERLRTALRRAGARPVHLEASALFEPSLNRRFAGGLNKNQALLQETGGHLVRLAEKFTDAPILAIVDKQGGRNDYLPFLSSLFPGAWFDVLETGAGVSRYRMRREGGDVEMRFLAKADRLSFPTALASLAAKYTREHAMTEFNGWFCARFPGLKPTAGYPEDARRWLDDVRRLGTDAELLLGLVIRER